MCVYMLIYNTYIYINTTEQAKEIRSLMGEQFWGQNLKCMF